MQTYQIWLRMSLQLFSSPEHNMLVCSPEHEVYEKRWICIVHLSSIIQTWFVYTQVTTFKALLNFVKIVTALMFWLISILANITRVICPWVTKKLLQIILSMVYNPQFFSMLTKLCKKNKCFSTIVSWTAHDSEILFLLTSI